MISSQSQTFPTTPADPNQDLPRFWKSWKPEHPEFNRSKYSIVAFEGKVLIIGGRLEDTDQRALNLILLDPENENFQIIPSVGDAAEICCNCCMSVCYWKDSKFLVFGGYDYSEYSGPSDASSAVGVITLKDLESENPSAHWEIMAKATQLSIYDHVAHIHEDKMYALGGVNQNGEVQLDPWCFDLTKRTWKRIYFIETSDPPKNYSTGVNVIFHENKAYDFLNLRRDKPIVEFDLGRVVLVDFFQMKVETRPMRFLPVPDFRDDLFCLKSCPQLVDGKIFFLAFPRDPEPKDPIKLQLWAFDLNLKNWIEIKTTEPIQNLSGQLVHCNNHLVYYGPCEKGSEVWSLPLNVLSRTNLSKAQQTMKDLLSEAPYSDISFEVESEIIKAHKWCLIKRNKFFANMFASGMTETQASTIKITDMKASTFRALLEFLYSDHVELNNELALDLLQQADKYSIDELKKACEKHLIENIGPENYVALGSIAELIGTLTLREAVVIFIAKNMKKLKQRKDFNDISEALLRDSVAKFNVK